MYFGIPTGQRATLTDRWLEGESTRRCEEITTRTESLLVCFYFCTGYLSLNNDDIT